jgi:hypothetical protein
MNDTSSAPRVRTLEPFRGQGIIRFEMPEDTLPTAHRARLLWRVVETLELSAFTAAARAVEGRQGRAVLSVRMQLTLWLPRLAHCARCARGKPGHGGCRASPHRNAGFPRPPREARPRVQCAGPGRACTDISVPRPSASAPGSIEGRGRGASAPSFRREASLQECLEQAALHVKGVFAEADDPEASEGEKLARLAGALDYKRRVEQAILTVQELRAEDKAVPRASTTDADARVMKMPDGGYRPGYNVQLATAGSELGGPRTIVGLLVTNVGSDMGSVTPMLADVESRTGQLPKQLLADANHAKHSCIEEATRRGVEVFIAVPKREQRPANTTASAEIVAWRERMQTDDAKRTYRARAALCELSNAHLKCHHGAAQVLVRGIAKVTCVALLAALTSNLLAHAAALLA